MALAPVQSQATESSHVWGGQHSVSGISGYIGAPGYIMVFDQSTTPVNGAVVPLIASIYCPAAGSWSVTFDPTPLLVSNGLTLAASSTGPMTLTLYATATFSALVS